MTAYYVNNDAQPNGDHEVHIRNCTYFPSNNRYLGDYTSCAPAVVAAKSIYWKSNGCYWCCRECHTT